MIRKIQVFGERCSGTNYMQTLIERNLEEVRITKKFGSKHAYHKGNVWSEDNCLFLVIYRNPLDWLRSMNAHPWHAHESLWGLDFSLFIRSEWVGVYDEKAGVGKGDARYGREMPWELDPVTGERFTNIIKLRGERTRRWQALSGQVNFFLSVCYEDVCKDPKGFIERLRSEFGLKKKWLFKPVDTYKGSKQSVWKYKKKKYSPILEADYDFICDQLDLELEAEIGYTLEDYNSYSTK